MCKLYSVKDRPLILGVRCGVYGLEALTLEPLTPLLTPLAIGPSTAVSVADDMGEVAAGESS
jgi:hypothetical protein